MRIGDQIAEALEVHGVAPGKAAGRGPRAAGRGRHPRPRRRARPVPARVLRRHAAARAHRHRRWPASPPARRRRADVGARRDRAAPDPRPPRRAHGRARHRVLFITHDLGARGRPGRPRRRDVRGRDRREPVPPPQILARPAGRYTKRLLAAAPSRRDLRAHVAGAATTSPATSLLQQGDGAPAAGEPIAGARLVKEFTRSAVGAAPATPPSNTSPRDAARQHPRDRGGVGFGEATVARMALGLETPTSGEVSSTARSWGPPPVPAGGDPPGDAAGVPGPLRLAQPDVHHRATSSTSRCGCSASATGPRAAAASRSCSTTWRCRRPSRSATPTSSRAGSGSVSRSPGPSRPTRG